MPFNNYSNLSNAELLDMARKKGADLSNVDWNKLSSSDLLDFAELSGKQITPEQRSLADTQDFDREPKPGFATGTAAAMLDTGLGIGKTLSRAPEAATRAKLAAEESIGLDPMQRLASPFTFAGVMASKAGDKISETLGKVSEGLRATDMTMYPEFLKPVGEALNWQDRLSEETAKASEKAGLPEILGSTAAPALKSIGNLAIGDIAGATEQFGKISIDDAMKAFADSDWSQLGNISSDPRAIATAVTQAAPSLLVAIYGGVPSIFALESLGVADNAKEYEKKTGIALSDRDFTRAVATAGAANTALELLGKGSVVGGRGGALRRAITGGTGEFATEVPQQLITNVAQSTYNPLQDISEGVVQSGIGGFGSGAAMSPFHAATSGGAPSSPPPGPAPFVPPPAAPTPSPPPAATPESVPYGLQQLAEQVLSQQQPSSAPLPAPQQDFMSELIAMAQKSAEPVPPSVAEESIAAPVQQAVAEEAGAPAPMQEAAIQQELAPTSEAEQAITQPKEVMGNEVVQEIQGGQEGQGGQGLLSESIAAPTVTQKQVTYKKRGVPSNPDLIQFLAHEGGIRDESGELQFLGLDRKFVPGAGSLVRQTGRSLDYAREKAREAGYGEFDTVADFIGALDENARGKRVYAGADAAARAATAKVTQQTYDESRQENEIYNHYMNKADEFGIQTEGLEIQDIMDAVHEREAIQAENTPIVHETRQEAIDREYRAMFPETQEQDIPFWGDEYADTGRGVATPEDTGREDEGQKFAEGETEATPDITEGAGAGGENVAEAGDGGAVEQTSQGMQRVIPGAEKISDRQLAERKMAAPMQAKAPQKPVGSEGGLFDTGARQQQELLQPTKGEGNATKERERRESNRQQYQDAGEGGQATEASRGYSDERGGEVTQQAETEEKIKDIKYSLTNTSKQVGLAPNGKKSNLSDFFWNKVRTPEFYALFGDWLHNPNMASKVLDENGEPLVLYRGSYGQEYSSIPNHTGGFVTFYTDSKENANAYASTFGEPLVSISFLGMVNPKIIDANGRKWFEASEGKNIDILVMEAKNNGYDGLIIKNVIDGPLLDGAPQTTYAVFSDKQVIPTHNIENKQFSVEFTAEINSIKRDILDAVSRINPKVQVKLVDNLFGEGPALLASGAKTTEKVEVAGSYSTAEGLEPLIEVSLNLNKFNPRETIYHELFHSIEQFLTPKEREVLDNAFPQRGNVTSKELRAQAFADVMIAKKFGNVAPVIVRVFKKIKSILEAIGNALRGRGFNSVDSIFSAVDTGYVAAREIPQEEPSLNDETDNVQFSTEDAYAMSPDSFGPFNVMYSLGDRNAKIVRDNKDEGSFLGSAISRLGKAIDEWKKSPKLDYGPDIGWYTNAIIYPRTIAQLYEHFTPVYLHGEGRRALRDTIAAETGAIMEPYYQLNNTQKDNVNAVLEVGRLAGVNFKVESGIAKINRLSVTVPKELRPQLSKPGQVISLSEEETRGYIAARAAMDSLLDERVNTTLRRYGYDPSDKASPRNAKEAWDLLRESIMSGDFTDKQAEIKNLADALQNLQDAKRKGYVPFSRFGNYAIIVKNSEGKVVHSEHIEVGNPLVKQKQRVEAARVIAGLEKKYPTSDGYKVSQPFKLNTEQAIRNAGLDVPSLDSVVAAAGLNNEYYDGFRDKLLTTMRKMGAGKHMVPAENIPGYSTDFERAMSETIYATANYIANSEYQPKFDEAIKNIPAVRYASLHKYARDYVKYITNPIEEFQRLKNTIFTVMLGGRISSAIVNHTQIATSTFPYLSQYVGAKVAAAELAKAYPDVIGMISFRGKMPYFNFDKAPEDVREDLKAANERGDLVPQMTFEQMGVANAKRRSIVHGRVRETSKKVFDAMADMYSSMERVNRIQTYIAAHRIARMDGVEKQINTIHENNPLWNEKGKFSPDKAASWVIDSTHFALGKTNRPRFMRGWSSSIFALQSFTFNQLELMGMLARNAVKGGDNKTKNAARKAIALMLTILLMGTGWQGLPFAEDIKDLTEMVHKQTTGIDLDIDKEVREWMYEATGGGEFGSHIGEYFSRGPARAIGIDVSQRIGMGNILPVDTIKSIVTGESTRGGFADVLGVPYDMLVSGTLRTIDAMKQHRPLYDIAAEFPLTPKSIGDIMRGYSWANNGVQSKGRTIIPASEISPMDALLKSIGFTSVHIAREREYEWMKTKTDTAVADLKHNYYTRLVKAIVNKDSDERMSIMNEINEHNKDADVFERIIIDPKYVGTLLRKEILGYDAKTGNKLSRPERRKIDLINPNNKTLRDGLSSNDMETVKKAFELSMQSGKPLLDGDVKQAIRESDYAELLPLFSRALPSDGKMANKYAEAIKDVG